MLHNITRYLSLITVITLSYFGLGLLGLQLAIPPSQAGAIWPPAGVGLVAMLLYGVRIWPGIFLGNFCVSAWAFGFTPSLFPVYIATGLGATLNTWVGSYLIRRTIGFPNDLLNTRDILLFFLLGGPVACLVSSTLGITTMWTMGVLHSGELLANWVAWWVGDTIGVLIFAPLLFTLLLKDSPVWQRRQLLVGIPLLVTFILVTGLFIFIQHLEYKRQYQQFINHSHAITQSIEHRLADQLRNAQAIHQAFMSSEHIEADEFQSFASIFLHDFPEIQQICWYSLNTATHSTSINRCIFDKPASPQPVPTQQLIDALQSSQGKYFQPLIVYAQSRLNYIIPIKHRSHPSDVVILTLDPKQLINNILAQIQPFSPHTFFIVDKTSHQTLFSNSASESSPPPIQMPINISNLNWVINFMFNKQIDDSTHWTLWWVIISGLVFVSLLGAGLLLLSGRYFSSEAIVKERTAELQAAKNHAEASSQAKSRFISNISHELRTPLNGIIGFTQILQKKTDISPNNKSLINIIEHCSQHLLNLIDDLLDIARIETNKITISHQTFRCTSFWDDIVSMFKLKAEEKKLRFYTDIRCSNPTITSDEKRLRQIIVNLLSNAIKFTDYGYVKLSVHNDNDYLHIIVEDSGCGISEADQQRIFTPFIQIDTRDFSKEGVGLGLTITQELVRLLGGSLQVSSQLDKGSVFSVKLPVQQDTHPKPHPAHEKEPASPGNKTPHILIAEDNTINILLLQNILDQLDCRYDTATDGQQAFEYLQQQTYDLALIDLNMPILSGMELIKKIKQQHFNLTTIAISAFAEQNKIDMALNSGFDYYLTKPIDANRLTEIITTIHY